MINQANATIFSNWKQSVSSIARDIVEKNLQEKVYDSLHTKQWGNTICQQIINKLSQTNHHFKYIVNCVLVAPGCNGLDMCGLCHWDSEMDGTIAIKHETKNITCIVNVYGCAL